MAPCYTSFLGRTSPLPFTLLKEKWKQNHDKKKTSFQLMVTCWFGLVVWDSRDAPQLTISLSSFWHKKHKQIFQSPSLKFQTCAFPSLCCGHILSKKGGCAVKTCYWLHTVDGRYQIPKIHLVCIKTCKSWGYLPHQLVIPRFVPSTVYWQFHYF